MNKTVIDLARQVATDAHAGQVDKLGVDYINHPAAVADYVQRLPAFSESPPESQTDALVASWLHDTVEDTGVTAHRLGGVGFSPAAVRAVVLLTRTPTTADDEYYTAIRGDQVALMVKVADLASNLEPGRVGRLPVDLRNRLAVKYEHALSVLGVDRSVLDGLHSDDERHTDPAGPAIDEAPEPETGRAENSQRTGSL